MTTPITANVTANLAPENMWGNAAGNLILTKIYKLLHFKERANSNNSPGVNRSPCTQDRSASQRTRQNNRLGVTILDERLQFSQTLRHLFTLR